MQDEAETFGLGPVKDEFLVLVREAGVGVKADVDIEGHDAVFDLVGDAGECAEAPDLGVFAPLLEVEEAAAASDVAVDEGGDGGEVAVPGIAGLVGVAIAAGAVEDDEDFGDDGCALEHGVMGGFGRVLGEGCQGGEGFDGEAEAAFPEGWLRWCGGHW